MPSAYLILHDNAGNYLITRKRIRNRWWNSRLRPSAIVNQANQFALPGGGVEGNETAYAAAVREFNQESGINLEARYGAIIQATHEDLMVRVNEFTAISFQVPQNQLAAICAEANMNVQPTPLNPHKPFGPVRDWEHSTFTIVSRAQLNTFLGAHQAIPMGDAHAVNSRPLHTQSIDWYLAIAEHIQAVHQAQVLAANN